MWALGPPCLLVQHTYLYYTLCLLYKRHSCIFYYLRNTIQSSSISNMISEPLLWPFLSSLVFIGVTPFSTSLPPSQQSPQPLAIEPLTSSSHCLRVPDLQPLSLRSPTPHRSLHMSLNRSLPSRAAWISCVNAPRAVQSSSWCYLWRHLLHVSPSYVSISHLLTSAPHHLGDVICWPWLRWPLTLTDRWLWPLTFFGVDFFAEQVLLTQFFA